MPPPDDASNVVTLPPPKAMPPMTTLTDMVKNPNIPGELMENTQKALSQISNMTAQIRAAQKQAQTEMDTVLENEAEAIKAKGQDGVNKAYDANKILSIVPQDQAQIYLDKRNAYMRYHSATSGWTPDTPYAQMQEDIEREVGVAGAPVNSPAYKTHIDMYEAAQKRALEMEKVRKQQQTITQEEYGRKADAMMLSNETRPPDVPAMSAEWLQKNAYNLSGASIKKVGDWLKGGTDVSAVTARQQAGQDALYMDRDAFRLRLFDMQRQKLLTNADVDHFDNLSKMAQDDAGVKFIKEAMDSKMLGSSPIMQGALNSLREKVVQQYLAERSAHPEWKDSDRLGAAMKMERANRLVDLNAIKISLTTTQGMQAAGISKDDLLANPAAGLAAMKKLNDDLRQRRAAGTLNDQQAVVEKQNYLAWLGYFSHDKKNEAARNEAIQILKKEGERTPAVTPQPGQAGQP